MPTVLLRCKRSLRGQPSAKTPAGLPAVALEEAGGAEVCITHIRACPRLTAVP